MKGMPGPVQLEHHLTVPEHQFNMLSICGSPGVFCYLCNRWLLVSQREHISCAEHIVLLPNPIPPLFRAVGIRQDVARPFITPEEHSQMWWGTLDRFYREHRSIHCGWFEIDIFEDEEPIYSPDSPEPEEVE